MPREYHSPSSIELVRRCPRAAAYRYIAGMRSPDPEWSEEFERPTVHTAAIAPWVDRGLLSPDRLLRMARKQRSTSLGKSVHGHLESHFRGVEPNWLATLPGRIAFDGLPHLPAVARPEVTVGYGQHGVDISDGRRAIEIGGVLWHGFVDADDSPIFPASRSVGVYDYKSTRDIARYAKSAAELTVDVQACLYAYDRALEFSQDKTPCRWIYFETGRVRRTKPVDFVITRSHALEVLESAAETAREFDLIESVEDAPMNTAACAEYGGCEFHTDSGGPCSARVSFGGRLQARVPKKEGNTHMPLDPNLRAGLKSKLSGLGALAPKSAPPPAQEAPAEEPEAPAADGAPVEQAAPAPPKPKAPKAAKVKAPAPSGGFADVLATHHAALSAAEAKLAEAQAERAAVLQALHEATAAALA